MPDVEAQTRALAHETDSAASHRQPQPILFEREETGGIGGAGLQQAQAAQKIRPERFAGERQGRGEQHVAADRRDPAR